MEKKYNVMDVINELRKIIRNKVLMVGGRPVKNTSKKDVYDIMEFIQILFLCYSAYYRDITEEEFVNKFNELINNKEVLMLFYKSRRNRK